MAFSFTSHYTYIHHEIIGVSIILSDYLWYNCYNYWVLTEAAGVGTDDVIRMQGVARQQEG